MAARVTKREVATLVAEIDRYLDAVDTFRAQRHEPQWRAESAPCAGAAVDPIRPNTKKRRGSSKPRKGG